MTKEPAREPTAEEIAEAEMIPAVWATDLVTKPAYGTMRIVFLDRMLEGSQLRGRVAVVMPLATAMALHHLLGQALQSVSNPNNERVN